MEKRCRDNNFEPNFKTNLIYTAALTLVSDKKEYEWEDLPRSFCL